MKLLAVFSVQLVGDDTLGKELVTITESPAPGLSDLSNFLLLSIMFSLNFSFSLIPEDDEEDGDAADCCPGVDDVKHLVAEDDDGGSLSVLFPKGRVCIAFSSDSGSPAPG